MRCPYDHRMVLLVFLEILAVQKEYILVLRNIRRFYHQSNICVLA
jgi:ABC-type glucose/galactose transport system permease subunit